MPFPATIANSVNSPRTVLLTRSVSANGSLAGRLAPGAPPSCAVEWWASETRRGRSRRQQKFSETSGRPIETVGQMQLLIVSVRIFACYIVIPAVT